MEPPMQLQVFETGPLDNNVYIVWCAQTGEGIVIDPAARAGKAIDFIREQNIKIKKIVYTHAHPDHVPGAAAFVKATGATVAAHRLAEKIMKGPIIRALSGFGLIFKAIPPSELLEDGDIVRAGNMQFTTLRTPGHSPDSICLLGHGAVFTGDLLFADGLGRTDIPGGSAKELARSIREKIMVLPPQTLVYPGHGPATTICAEFFKKNC